MSSMSFTDQMSWLWSHFSWSDLGLPKKKEIIYTDAPAQASSCFCLSNVTRLAGISGAVAVGFGAYGAHVIRDNEEVDVKRKKAFETASRYHLVHTLALLASPSARYPWLTTGVFLCGIITFCLPNYHYGLTAEEYTRVVTPFGGVFFILGWLTFLL